MAIAREAVSKPDLHIPAASSTVVVRVIDSTSHIEMDLATFFAEHIEGHDLLEAPSYSFLIQHETGNFLFDLGVRKDPENLPPGLWARLSKRAKLNIQKNVADILKDDKQLELKPESLSGIIWSHHHFDHIGDMSTFPGVPLIVGSGFTQHHLPGYPLNPDSALFQADFEDREVRQIDIDTSGDFLSIGSSPAHDFFGDGSFYLLDMPGHSVGHMCGLARVTSSPPSFVLMGGDACHHAGEFRPTQYLPLPKVVLPSPLPIKYPGGCPGHLLEEINPSGSAESPFYTVKPGFSDDHDKAIDSIHRIEELDASDDILVIIAHDNTLGQTIPLFPATINDWKSRNLKHEVAWAFTRDFKLALEHHDG